jgi:hypothetical protein
MRFPELLLEAMGVKKTMCNNFAALYNQTFCKQNAVPGASFRSAQLISAAAVNECGASNTSYSNLLCQVILVVTLCMRARLCEHMCVHARLCVPLCMHMQEA